MNAKIHLSVAIVSFLLLASVFILTTAKLVEARTQLRAERENNVGFIFADTGEAWAVCMSMRGNSCGGIRKVPDGWVLEPRTEF